MKLVLSCLVLFWRMTGSPPHRVSRQWAVVVRYGMRQALACQADFWRQLGSPALLNNNNRELVPIINRSGCKWTAKLRWRCPYCSKFEPMIRSLWFCYPQPLSQDQRPHVQWRPYTIKPVWGLADDHSDLANRDHVASVSHWMSSCDPLWQTSVRNLQLC